MVSVLGRVAARSVTCARKVTAADVMTQQASRTASFTQRLKRRRDWSKNNAPAYPMLLLED